MCLLRRDPVDGAVVILLVGGGILLAWLSGCFLAGFVAMGKGRSFIGHFLIALIFTPMVDLLVLIALPSIDRSRAAGLKVCRSCSKTYDGTQHWSCPHCKAAKKLAATPIKTCPFCAEKVLAAAIKCKHCGSELPAGAPLP